MIPLQKLQDMFTGMRAQTKWNVDGDLLWGYFFTSRDRTKLEPVAQNLLRAGYRVVRIFQTDDRRIHVLHVERVETHTPETLHARNTEFYKIATAFGLDSYDGMDVGPATTT
jgi:hypothetical protein